MPTAKELREKRAPLAAAIRKLSDKANNENRDFTAEEKAEWEKVNTDYNSMTAQIERVERAEAVEAEQGPPTDWRASVGRGNADGRDRRGTDGATQVTEQHRAMALSAWCRSQFGCAISQDEQEACHLAGLNPFASQLNVSLLPTSQYADLRRRFGSVHVNRAVDHCRDFKAALSIGSGPSGGYLIPPETLIRQLEVNMLAFGGVRQVAETIRTATGEPLSWPTADDTSNTGAQLGENTTIGSSVEPSFGKVSWGAYKFSSKPVLVPYELIEDSAFDLPNLLGAMLGERLGRITNTRQTTGTGAATCKGIVTCATAFSAASATAISFDDVLGLEHSVDPAYRMGAGYMMHDSILLYCRKLKDGNGQYLWQSNINIGTPDSFFGKPLTINQDMDSTISSGKKTILFGQLSSYKIRTVGSMRMYRLEERYRDTDQDGFIALLREDANLLTSGTARVKVLTH